MSRRFVEGCLSLSTLLALVGLVIPLLGAAGWIFNLPILTQVHPSLPAMQPNTALVLLLGAVAVLLSRSNWRLLVRSLAICSLATIVLLLGSATLCEYIFGWDFGIDRLFVHERAHAGQPLSRPPFASNVDEFCPPRSQPALAPASAPAHLRGPDRRAAHVRQRHHCVDRIYFWRWHALSVACQYGSDGHGGSHCAGVYFLSMALLCSRPSEGVMTLDHERQQ